MCGRLSLEPSARCGSQCSFSGRVRQLISPADPGTANPGNQFPRNPKSNCGDSRHTYSDSHFRPGRHLRLNHSRRLHSFRRHGHAQRRGNLYSAGEPTRRRRLDGRAKCDPELHRERRPDCLRDSSGRQPLGRQRHPYQQITINPAVYGKGSTAGWTVFAFSQEGNLNGPGDPQVLQMVPNVVPRAWARWDTGGTRASDYNFGYPAQAEAAGITFVGGTTATVLFPDEFPVPANFNAVVSCNADGQPVFLPAPQGFYRGSIASPAYRQYIIGIGEIQIDGGVDGLFFDEVGGSYNGVSYDSNNGFDDADVADFGGFLCAKYPNLTTAQWQSQFGITSADNLNCSAASSVAGRTFNYRGYLVRNGWDTDPLSSSNPLAAEWGTTNDYHPRPQNGTFTNTYLYLVYWQDIVLQVRNYARQKYGKEIYITANGVFPFVDFQAKGINDFNDDGPGGVDVDYCPLTANGDLNGSQSLMQAFLTTKQRSANVAGRVVPVSEFLDWPSGPMSRYLSLPAKEYQDYWRMYVPEALAVGVNLAMHLEDTIGDPTATQLGLMPYFDQTAAFYEAPAHAALYQNAQNLATAVTVSAPNVSSNLTRLSDGRTVAHLINHNYAAGFQTQSAVTVTFPLAAAPTTVTLVSPDASADTTVPFIYANGQVQVTIPQLVAYTAVVAQ